MCIRCSGIHRGMGTHISRVKSVDLDSWTDEQVQSVLKWGNARANKYWEAKLAPGHVPSEAKIENFIRTKYDSKRWVMDGPIPDPSTLDVDGDDDIPLGLVKEKHNLERSTSQRTLPRSALLLNRISLVMISDHPRERVLPVRYLRDPHQSQSRLPQSKQNRRIPSWAWTSSELRLLLLVDHRVQPLLQGLSQDLT